MGIQSYDLRVSDKGEKKMFFSHLSMKTYFAGYSVEAPRRLVMSIDCVGV